MTCCSMSGGYSRRQWLTLVLFSVGQFCNAVCVSLQAPFYPHEAEKKGATSTQYGFVFGVFELTVFLVSPLYGRCMGRWKPKTMNNTGIFVVSIMSILFGFLDRINDTNTFIALSFVVRIIEAMGNAAFITSAFSIIAKEFPKNVGAAFAAMETFFGLGLIAGPTVGGALYEVGGYTLPFATLGGVLLVAALIVTCLLPAVADDNNEQPQDGSGQLLAALRLPSILLASFAILSTSISIGYLQATLEPHLRPLKLSPLKMGLMFVLNGSMYALTAPVWGWLCDKYMQPRVGTAIGSLLIVVAFTFVGPMPFLPLQTSLGLSIATLILHGIGIGASLVSTFTSAHRDVLVNGFPDDLGTYGLVSGIWTSSFALGCFIGPSVGGVLLDLIGFAWGTVFVVALHVLVALCMIMYTCCKKPDRVSLYATVHESLSQGKEERQSLIVGSYQTIGESDSTYGSARSSQENLPCI